MSAKFMPTKAASGKSTPPRGIVAMLLGLCALVAGCYYPSGPTEINALSDPDLADNSVKIAALDYAVGDLTDPAVLAKYTRAEIVVIQPWQYWDNHLDLSLLRAAKPDIKILAYFRPKSIRFEWATPPAEGQELYSYDLWRAGIPHLAFTTTGDTIQDWPKTYYTDMADPDCRRAMRDVFLHYQATSGQAVDGIFYDYFGRDLYIAPQVATMEGEPDIDGDGVVHWDDEDELAAFRAGQEAWIQEVRAALGEDFIQIANGNRAVYDSTFAGLLDGMFYEIFPDVGFSGRFRQALDPATPNNLFAARHWPRTRNGGPWLILEHAVNVGIYMDPESLQMVPINTGDLLRAIALLTDATSIHYDCSGLHRSGIPSVEATLGLPLGGVQIAGEVYSRDFQFGRVELVMGTGTYPFPYSFTLTKNGTPIQIVEYPYTYP